MNPWVGLGTNSAIEDAELLTNALANWSEDNWKENIRNYELGLRGRGSFYANLTRSTCLMQHQACENFLNLMIRNITFRINSLVAYIKSSWHGDCRERDNVNKND
ncbi:hypothetical protein RclHR1_17550002 [Rhizophagus clarus]|nr:hypothetical protein RclHR1_17550002 [Rhizophagus clarus]